ncbi:hypothetical protein F4809DRAFT_608555 [Biscogniauxia mediterranea]|nr:hypothetical protein F4809DRAFT_608555 [Biscogniauxia mediterranea]
MANRKDAKPATTNGQIQEFPEYPFRVLSSDGQVWDDSKINKHHERLPDQDPRCDAWKDKLGSMLGRQLFPKDERIFYLEDLPLNYHLRVKSNGKDGRQDLYLYGYPGDKGSVAKSFRSPAEFFPHLLWLSRGGERKREDCSCCLCNPSGKPRSMSIPTISDMSTPGIPAAAIAGQSTGMTNSPKISAKDVTPAVPPPKPKATIPAPQRAPLQSATNPPLGNGPPTPLPIPPSTTTEQQNAVPGPIAMTSSSSQAVSRPPSHIDTIFRGGEVVWYKNNYAWRLGIIINTDPTGVPVMRPTQYTLIPLAHNKFPVECVEKPETDMRPFLAFSVPQLNRSISELNGRPMADIDWESVQSQLTQNDPQRKEMLALEASKLAATLIDHSYSTFNPIGRLSVDTEAFGGVFLGAEKVCIGEAVRLLLPPEEQNPQWSNSAPVVMVVKQICVKSQGGEVLYFSGDVWRLQELNFQQPDSNQQQQLLLPVAMRQEKLFRDGVLRSRGLHVDWILIAEQVTKEQQAVRGRFYETNKLAPILNPETFEHSLAQGAVADLQSLLNNRGDSNGPYVGRRADRAATVAGAIPDAFLASVASAS